MRLDKTGTILITSLWIVAILSILAIGIGFRVSLELRLSKYNMDKLKALYLAKAGLDKCQEILSKDNNDYDSIYECGITLTGDETPNQIFMNNKLGEGSFSVSYREEGTNYPGMMDEDRKININLDKSTHNDTIEFRRILKGLSPNLTDDIINAIIDWQDADSNSTLPGGAENNDYYQTLDHPYECKNADFSCIEELLLVKDMTTQLFDEIKDYITVYGNGQVNINTASERVLNAIINDATGTYSSLIAKIIDYRNGTNEKNDPDGRKDDAPIIALNNIPGLEPNESSRLSSLANYFVFAASNFRIESKGIVDKSRFEKVITCVTTKDTGGNFKLISYHEH